MLYTSIGILTSQVQTLERKIEEYRMAEEESSQWFRKAFISKLPSILQFIARGKRFVLCIE